MKPKLSLDLFFTVAGIEGKSIVIQKKCNQIKHNKVPNQHQDAII